MKIKQIKQRIKEIEKEGERLKIYDYKTTEYAYLQGKLEALATKK